MDSSGIEAKHPFKLIVTPILIAPLSIDFLQNFETQELPF